MYWFIGSLIIIAMMGVLAVADSMALPIQPFWLDITNTSPSFLLLVIFAIILMVIAQFNTPPAPAKSASQNSASHSSRYFRQSFRLISYLSFFVLAIGLIVGSALQALVSHQHATDKAISEPMRVQALVTIEGVSDSVYDVDTQSGYRQVAVISQITPLVSELSTQDLDSMTIDYLADSENSLSINKASNATLNITNDSKHDNKNLKYRVLLNAYPKKPSKQPSKPSSKKLSKNSSKKLTNDSQFATLNHLQPSDQLFMSLTLEPLESSEQAIKNPSGFDSYRWLRGRHIDGVANVLAISTSTANNTEPSKLAHSSQTYIQRFRTRIDQGRWQLRQHFYQNWSAQTPAEQQAKAVTLSLLTGDRSLINRETKDLYQLAGISHLLAISGTHVLFLAIVLAGAAVFIFDRLWPAIYRHIPRWQVRWWVMIGAAFVYALFTGFDVPAARTAWMLLAIGLVRLTLLPVSTMRVLLALAVLMAWHDPYVLWQAGFWLSFIAVALLLKYDDTSYQYKQSNLPPYKNNSDKANVFNGLSKRVWIIGTRIFKLQFWLFLTLLPITLLLFGKASLWGIFINLFAIGLFGWVIVPLNLLAGLCYLLSPAIADGIWALVAAIVAGLHKLMMWLTSLPALSEAWLYTPVNMAILLMMLLSILPWLLPRGLISRWLTLPPLTLLMMTVYANQQSLAMTPTLYILPTGDHYISAALLQYPVKSNEDSSESTNGQSSKTNDKNSSWLLLTDHRQTTTRTMPSHLTAEQLSAVLEQQLGSLSIDKLEGIIVQSSSAGLTDTLTTADGHKSNNNANFKNSELLPMTVVQLNQYLPINQYWQAGRSDRWPALQQAYKVTSQSQSKSEISAQRCEQGKRWQLMNGELSIQALTGWSKVGDASVWDCTVAIDSRLPMRVLQYNAADPLNSLPAIGQTLTPNSHLPAQQAAATKSRLIVNADTHQRVWQMWELLCPIESPNQEAALSTIVGNVTWVGHSTSHITSDMLSRQNINNIITYDDTDLETAF